MNKEINGVLFTEEQFFNDMVGTRPINVYNLLRRLQNFYDVWDSNRFDDNVHHKILNILCREQWLKIDNKMDCTIFIDKNSTSGAKYIPPSTSKLAVSNYNHIIVEKHNNNIILKVM
jgi:hypothetical protein